MTKKTTTVKLSEAKLKKYCGFYWCYKLKFGRKIILKDGALHYFRSNKSITELAPISANEFLMVGINDVTVKFEFKQNKKLYLIEKDKMTEFEIFDGLDSETVKKFGNFLGIEVDDPDAAVFYMKYFIEWEKKRKAKRLEIQDQPCFTFVPFKDKKVDLSNNKITLSEIDDKPLPRSKEDIAFATIRDLANWIRSGKLTSVRLTQIYLDRIKKYACRLNCVITITEDLALKQAKKADEEISKGKYKGLLHGIPYGLKDIIDTKGIPTTWGLDYYKNRKPRKDATVVKLLQKAGAVLVAKLSLGKLASGTTCFIGETKNPWDKREHAGGSSSGPGAAVSAGFVAFSIGTETLGSIEFPSSKCGICGLRPSFGRISRTGVMNQSWTFDKVGPLCRSVEDTLIVLSILNSYDEADFGSKDFNLSFNGSKQLKGIKFGYNDKWFIEQTKEVFDKLVKNENECIDITEYDLNKNDQLILICILEANASLEDFVLHEFKNLKSENDKSCYNTQKHLRPFAAYDYIHLQQYRTKIMKQIQNIFKDVDCLIVSPWEKACLYSNLTGHPSITIPVGIDDKGMPIGITLVGRMYDEGNLCRIAMELEKKFNFAVNRPQDYKYKRLKKG